MAYEKELEELKNFCEIGDDFMYLGRKCVVTGHVDVMVLAGSIPCLKYQYSDENGVIHSVCAGMNEFRAIKKQSAKNTCNIE